MKKILLIGATGTLGSAIAAELSRDHELIAVGHARGDLQVDIRSDASVEALFECSGPVDAIVSAAGRVHFGALPDVTSEQFDIGLQDKLLGQVRLTLIGQRFLRPGGSITLTSGILSEAPIRQGANATTVNAALEGFARAAAIELAPQRINVVSPTVLSESAARFGDFFSGFEPAPGARVALAYRRSVDGAQTGQVYKVW